MNNNLNRSVIIIGDIHGRTIWKTIIALHPEDQIVFVGDYFDSKEGFSAFDQINNFTEIADFKKNNPERVTLLFGNHDYHYLPEAGETYSGYQQFFAHDIRDVLMPAIGERLFSIGFLWDHFLISHAGFTRTWCRAKKISITNPVQPANELFYTNPHEFAYSPGPLEEPSGNEPQQGPLWVRPYSLASDPIPGFVQVVGHTQSRQMLFLPGIIVVDVLNFTPQYLEINEKGETTIKNL